jgi:hypothetical protein
MFIKYFKKDKDHEVFYISRKLFLTVIYPDVRTFEINKSSKCRR